MSVGEQRQLVKRLVWGLQLPTGAGQKRGDMRVHRGVSYVSNGLAGDVVLDGLVIGVRIVAHVGGLNHVPQQVHRLAQGAIGQCQVDAALVGGAGRLQPRGDAKILPHAARQNCAGQFAPSDTWAGRRRRSGA